MSGRLRLLAAMLLVVCGWCAGNTVCLRARAHLEALQATLGLLQLIRQEIACRQTGLDRLYCRLVREGTLPPTASPDGRLQTLTPPSALEHPEAALFTECFAGLGRTPAAQECARLELYIARFDELLRQAQTRAAPLLALAQKLGVGVGLAAALFFL